jgi:hypothetical protein
METTPTIESHEAEIKSHEAEIKRLEGELAALKVEAAKGFMTSREESQQYFFHDESMEFEILRKGLGGRIVLNNDAIKSGFTPVIEKALTAHLNPVNLLERPSSADTNFIEQLELMIKRNVSVEFRESDGRYAIMIVDYNDIAEYVRHDDFRKAVVDATRIEK